MLKSYPLSILFLAAQHHRLGSSSACNIFYHVSVGSVFVLLPFFPLLTLQWLYSFWCFWFFSVYICLDLSGGFLLNGTDEMRMKMHACQMCFGCALCDCRGRNSPDRHASRRPRNDSSGGSDFFAAKPIKTCQFKSKGATGGRHHHPHIDFPLIHKRVEFFAPPTPKSQRKRHCLRSVCP